MALDTLDRGYAWVVMGACFVLQMLISFNFASFGFFLVEYIEYFHKDKTVTSWVGAVLFATTGIMGMFAGPLVHRFGCRRMTQVGTMLVFIGLGSSAYVTNVYVLYLTHGFIAGVGFCIWSVCAMVGVQLFFDKRRGFATAFTTIGKSAGVLLWSWLTPFTIDIYTFKGALLIQAAVSLHGLVIAAILRRPVLQSTHPVQATRGQLETETDKYDGQYSQDESEDGSVWSYSGSTEMLDMSLHSGNKSGRPPSTNNEGMSVYEVETGKVTICGENKDVTLPSSQEHLRRRLKFSDILDFSLLCKVPKITLFYISIFLVMSGDQVPYVFLPVRLAEKGRSKDDAAMLVTILGITTVVSRLLCGWMADVVDRNVMYAVASVANGLVSVAFAFVTNFGALTAYCISFSVSTAGYACCGHTLVGDILGMERLAKGIGLLFFFVGAGSLLGTPLGGFIIDITGSSSMAFLILGSIQASGGVVWVAVIMYEWYHDASKRTCIR